MSENSLHSASDSLSILSSSVYEKNGDESEGNKNIINHSHLFVFSGGNKAGMEHIDKQKQTQIIYETSKNSAYFKRAEEQDRKTQAKVAVMKTSLQSLSSIKITSLSMEVEKRLINLEKRRSFDRICCVLDMDMFFAAIEIRDQPHLKEKPVAVGGESMICTANYVARKYGVRSAMPGFIAKKLCPHLIFVPVNFDKYQIVSEQICNVIKEYDSSFKSWSLDEVYFNLTDISRKRLLLSYHESPSSQESKSHLYPSIENIRRKAFDILNEIRLKITNVTNGLTCSAGMANNFFLAKVCAEINKPDGQYELPPTRQDILQFLSKLPTRKIGGIGKVTEKILSDLDIHTMNDVKNNLYKILHVMSPAITTFLIRTSIGISEEEVNMISSSSSSTSSSSVLSSPTHSMPSVDDLGIDRKSMGAERTFRSISNPIELRIKLHEICEIVGNDMKKEDLVGKCVTLKLKTVHFELLTRAVTCTKPIQSPSDIEKVSLPILEKMLPINIRLMGITMSKLEKSESFDHISNKRKFFQMTKFCEEESRDLIPESELSSLSCPVCNKSYSSMISLNIHVDKCLNQTSLLSSSSSLTLLASKKEEKPFIPSTLDSSCRKNVDDIHSYICPLCRLKVTNILSLNIHVDRCLMTNSQSKEEKESIEHHKVVLKSKSISGNIDRFFIKS